MCNGQGSRPDVDGSPGAAGFVAAPELEELRPELILEPFFLIWASNSSNSSGTRRPAGRSLLPVVGRIPVGTMRGDEVGCESNVALTRFPVSDDDRSPKGTAFPPGDGGVDVSASRSHPSLESAVSGRVAPVPLGVAGRSLQSRSWPIRGEVSEVACGAGVEEVALDGVIEISFRGRPIGPSCADFRTDSLSSKSFEGFGVLASAARPEFSRGAEVVPVSSEGVVAGGGDVGIVAV
jgi:hypothetical protein